VLFKIFRLEPDSSNSLINWSIFSFNVVLWDDDDKVRFVLDQQAELDFHSASSLKQQSEGRHIAPLGQIIPIASQPVFALSP
jgi:hypothetical protein